MNQKILLISDSPKAKELAAVLQQSGAATTLAPDPKIGLELAREIIPDAIAFVLPFYWESLLPFLEGARADKHLVHKPIVNIGSDVMEGAEETVLKGKNVRTITLGPVPMQEIARYILNLR